LHHDVAGFPEKFLIESSSRAGTTGRRRSWRRLTSNSKKTFEKVPRAGRRCNWNSPRQASPSHRSLHVGLRFYIRSRIGIRHLRIGIL
jgi:hypothetical protein